MNMPPAPKSPQARRLGAPKTKGAVRAKSGCYTCRIRRKKCDEQMSVEGSCSTCVRLRLQCLGFGAKRPEWLRENRNVLDLREKIKTFLASQGMIKGHSGSAPRASEQEPQILALSADYVSPSNSPQTPTLSISSTNDDRPPPPYPLRTDRYTDNDRLPVMHELSPDSPLERAEYSEVLLPAVSYSVNTSIEPWASYPLQQRPHFNPFSRVPNLYLPDDDEIDVVSSGYILSSAPVVDQHPWPLLDAHQENALHYYMTYVLHMQYLHANESLGGVIWNLIHSSDNARQAVCLLSELHRKSIQKHNFGIVEQLEDAAALRHLQTVIPSRSPLTEGDALAGLSIVSYFLFRGGQGQWQMFLDVVCTYALSILNSPHGRGPLSALYHCSEGVRFIIKTTIWFDVLASATLVREPRLLGVIRDLFNSHQTFFGDEPQAPMEEFSMMDVMGCENHIVLALAEIAGLASWKEAQINDGSLSVIDLVRRGKTIENILRDATWHPYQPDVSVDPEARQRAHQRHLTSEVFRASAHVYLHSVVSGDFPRCPEIIEAVNETVRCLMDAQDGPTGRAVVRSVVFSICICGCLTEDPKHQAYFLTRLQEQQVLSIGNSLQVSDLIKKVWQRRSQSWEAVDWRKVMKEAEMLLV